VGELLSIHNLEMKIGGARERVHVLRGVNLAVQEKSSLGLVGESGSGKTMTALTIMRLLPRKAEVTGGKILLSGEDILQYDERQMEKVRGRQISMIFQNASASLNPVFTVGEQIADVYCQHRGGSKKEGLSKAAEVLAAMGMPAAAQRARAYPHELSGGMCQRVLIAMALVCSPRLLIADEVTSGLDVTIQAQVLELIMEVVKQIDATLIFITHDIGVIAEACTDVAVMYSGQVVEVADTKTLLERPAHPYSKGLLSCFTATASRRMGFIPGAVPDLRINKPECPFAPRCPLVEDRCKGEVPLQREIEPGHLVACHIA